MNTALPQILRDLADRVEAGRLPPARLARLEASAALVLRDAALRRAAELVDPSGGRSTWAVSERLAAILGRFEATAWPRIRAGARSPRDSLEVALSAALEHEAGLPVSQRPRSARRLYDILSPV